MYQRKMFVSLTAMTLIALTLTACASSVPQCPVPGTGGFLGFNKQKVELGQTHPNRTDLICGEDKKFHMIEVVEPEEPSEGDPGNTDEPEGTSEEIPEVQTFDYLPGGEGVGKTATDVLNPEGRSGCFRWWKATNLENLPWLVVFCNWQGTEPAPNVQVPHPSLWEFTKRGTISFELWQDHEAEGAYEAANVKNSQLGLGVFFKGTGSEVCVNGECQTLDGGGVFQAGFPEDWDGYHEVTVKVLEDAGHVDMWVGEKLTSEDNWPAD